MSERPKRGQLFLDDEGKWRFRVLAANGEIIANSEGYSRRIDAQQTLLNLGVSEDDVTVLTGSPPEV